MENKYVTNATLSAENKVEILREKESSFIKIPLLYINLIRGSNCFILCSFYFKYNSSYL